jgi:hypothetical protein
VGLCLGGITTAVLAVALGSLLVRPFVPDLGRVLALAALAVFVLAGEFGLHRVALPHRRAQVPASVVGVGAQSGALQFGFEMGTGVRTHMPSNLPYLPLAAVLLIATWPQALLAGAGFGLGRAWMALGRHYSRAPEWWDARWRRHGTRLRRVLAVALLVALVVALLAAGIFPL